MTGGDNQRAAGAPPTAEAASGSSESELGVAATAIDTRPSADVRALESARTAAVTPFESARTALQASSAPLETARTALLTPGDAVPAPGALTMKPFGPYSRIETLGQQGNMGVVARGYNQSFGRWELLKFLKPELLHDPELLRQFRREGRALARLSHPNVVQVFAMYDHDAQPCLAMEFLEGHSLSTELERAGGRLAQDRAQELLLDAARGLAAAHELGLLHRDIKPDNLFVTLPGKGRVAGLKLIDFGLATADKARPEELQRDPSLASDATGGTPLFLAPELWQGRDPTPSTDLYALGVSFFNMLTGQYPCGNTALSSVISYCASPKPAPSVALERSDLGPAFAGLIDRLIDKDPARRLESAEKLVTELLAQRQSARPRRVPGAGPYRGLTAFGESERDVFFGRERDIAEITERLRTQLGLILVGPVACGKTSLARAGVVPAIRDGVLGGGYGFEALLLEPRSEPLRALAGALAPLLRAPEAELAQELGSQPGDLRAIIERRLAPERGLLIVVDQLEELAGIAQGEALRFARALESLLEVESPRLRLLATARSDVVDRLFALGSLRGLLTRGFHPVGPLSEDGLVQALREPAQIAGYRFENPELLAQVAHEAQGSAAGLSLSSLALQRYFQLRDEASRTLTEAAWQSLGGVVGALLEHADAVWQSLGTGERAAAEDVVLRLISSRGGRVSARRETLLDPAGGGEATRRALERLLATRLCVEVAGEVELVHDALATTWPVVRELLARVGVDQQLRQRVSQAAQQWQEQERPDGLLWASEQAERLLTWFQGAEQTFTLLELEFVAAVRKQATRARRLRRVGMGAAGFLILTLVSWLALRDRRLSAELSRTREQAAAESSKQRLQAARLLSDRARLTLLDAPAAALSDAQASGKLLKDPGLDSVAWQALLLGVPFGLPLQQGGAGWVASDGEYVVTTGTEALHALRIVGAGAGLASLPKRKDGGLPSVSALALAGDAWLGTTDGWLFRASYRFGDSAQGINELALVRVGQAPGGVREIITREKRGLTLVCSVRGSTMTLQAAESGALRTIWQGPAKDVAVDAAGERLAVATALGEILVGRFDDTSKLESLGNHDAHSVAFWGEHVLAGDGSGRVLTFAEGKEPKQLGLGLEGVIVKLEASRSAQALVAQSARGMSAVYGPDLAQRARVRTSGSALRFLEGWRAVALVDEQQRVMVLGYDTGRELVRLRGGGARVTSLGATDSWLLASALDGGVRAYSLTASLPKAFAPPPGRYVEGAVSPRGVVAALTTEGLGLRSNQSGPQPSVPLAAEQRPATKPLLSVGAGVGFVRGPRAFAYWDRQQLTTGELTRPIQRVLALQGKQELLVAIEGAAPETTELVRVHPGGAEQPSAALPGLAVALAELPEGDSVAVLLHQGPLRVVSDLGRGEAVELELQPGARRALAVSSTGSHFAVGYDSGLVAVGKTRGGPARAVRVTGAPVSCIAFGRDERVLVVGDAQGQSSVLDLDSERVFPMSSRVAGPLDCAYDATRERYVFLDGQGNAWTQALDTTPLSFLPQVEDPLHMQLDKFRGLEAAP